MTQLGWAQYWNNYYVNDTVILPFCSYPLSRFLITSTFSSSPALKDDRVYCIFPSLRFPFSFIYFLLISTNFFSSLSAEYNISAAAIAIFSLFFMILGTLCVIFSFGKGRDYLLRPAGMFFAFAGQLLQMILPCIYSSIWAVSLSLCCTPSSLVINVTYAELIKLFHVCERQRERGVKCR